MATSDIATALSAAFRQLSDALHQASVACKDLEYTVPLLAKSPGSLAGPAALATTAADAAPEKKKRKRDPNEPRRPPSAYLLFTADVREGVQKANTDMKPAEVMSKLASMWKDLSDAQKRPYEERAEKAKHEYIQEREKYEQDHPELAKKRRRVSSQPPKGGSKTLPSPTASPVVDGHAPATPAAKVASKDSKHSSSKKDKAPKPDKKSSGKEKEKEEKKRRRRSEGFLLSPTYIFDQRTTTASHDDMADDVLETLQARHKKEIKAMTAQIMALKKTATKGDRSKRKEVLAEVEKLEKETRDRHDRELQQYESRDVNKPSDHDCSMNLQKDTSIEEQSPVEDDTLQNNFHQLKLSSSPKPNEKPKPNRQKARMMKRAAEMEKQRQLAANEALDMPDLQAQENASMRTLLDRYGLKEEAVRPDGNCLYAAFALQLNRRDPTKYDTKSLRNTAASFIRGNKADFEPFLYADEHSAARDIDSYCQEIEENCLWGGELEITALSRSLGVPVEIYSTRSNSPLTIENGSRHDQQSGVIRLAYYQHMYGLGQHYNALYKV